ncbi:MAG TPA: PLD nuclease N-terminal domain-containing protein [Gemmataceae bacterium]
MSGDFFAILAFAAFWSFVVGLDLACLWNLRRSRIEATARVLWVIWIVAVPVIGAISYFIVQPTREEGEMRSRDWPLNQISLERPRQSENIHR